MAACVLVPLTSCTFTLIFYHHACTTSPAHALTLHMEGVGNHAPLTHSPISWANSAIVMRISYEKEEEEERNTLRTVKGRETFARIRVARAHIRRRRTAEKPLAEKAKKRRTPRRARAMTAARTPRRRHLCAQKENAARRAALRFLAACAQIYLNAAHCVVRRARAQI